ncbi:MAG: amidohydrolase family protein [Myxococcales bacterium]|nr:amidohydrolase family protein [Myxococcales bacterium]
MSQYDLVVRGGSVLDGSGEAVREADVAIVAGRVVEVGRVEGRGHRELDARGLLVTPGFVDVHTHYDGQATWDGRLWPSSWHGVTTAVMGNCGVGFAPCRPEDRELLIRLMEGVEDIPNAVLNEGLDWRWQSFPEFLDALAQRPHDIDFATQVPHAALRVFAMGERGANREPASADEIATMAELAAEGVRAGALGFSTSRTLNHRTSDGQPTPTLTAGEDELLGIAMGLSGAGAGVLQVVSDFKDPVAEMQMLRRIVERSGRPLSISLVQNERRPEGWRYLLSQIEEAASASLPIKAQVCGRAVGIVLGLDATLNPFSGHPAFRSLQALPLSERVARLREPGLRAELCDTEAAKKRGFAGAVLQNFDKMFMLGDRPDYEPSLEESVQAHASARGVSAAEVALDAMLEHDGRGLLYVPFLNYADGSLEPSLEMMRHQDTILGLGDGGAHVGMICDGSFPTYMLTHWTRDRSRGEKLSLPWVIKAQCADTAAAMGLFDRGLLRPGYKADLNLIDYERLQLHAPEVVHDLPAGGKRLLQRAEGYVATVVSGEVVYENGEATGVLPGQLIRGAQSAPV